jgi:hypothetical protein
MIGRRNGFEGKLHERELKTFYVVNVDLENSTVNP